MDKKLKVLLELPNQLALSRDYLVDQEQLVVARGKCGVEVVGSLLLVFEHGVLFSE